MSCMGKALSSPRVPKGTLSLISFLTNDIVRYVPRVALIVV